MSKRHFDDWLAELRTGLHACLKQNIDELYTAWIEVNAIRPKTFMEIGALEGGSLFMYAAACAQNAHLIVIDKPRRGDEPFPKLLEVIQYLRQERKHEVTFIIGGSHDGNIIKRIQREYESLDVLHIDGAHSYSGVSSDMREYGPLVRRGGLILLHDIQGAPGVKQLWNELKGYRRKLDLTCGPIPGQDIVSGLGLLEID